jgi:tetratricopeptide (TPR) repeat protein
MVQHIGSPFPEYEIKKPPHSPWIASETSPLPEDTALIYGGSRKKAAIVSAASTDLQSALKNQQETRLSLPMSPSLLVSHRHRINRAMTAGVLLFIAFLALLVPVKASASAESSNKYAIIVGIDDYEDQEVTRLHCAVSDAKAMNALLIKRLGFDEERIFLFTSDQKGKAAAKRGNIAVALGNIQTAIKPGGSFIFFFSGHGIAMEGENFLLTQEAIPTNRVSLEETALKVSRVREYIEKMQADKVLLIVDACRIDPGGKKGGARNLMGEDFARGLIIKTANAEKGNPARIRAAATLFSCSKGESSYEWTEKNNGFFTYFLLKGIQGEAADGSGRVTLNSLESYISQKVKDAAKVQRGVEQTPWMERSGTNPGAWALVGSDSEGATAIEDNQKSAAPTGEIGNLLQKAVTYQKMHDHDSAITALSELIRRAPNNAEAYHRRGYSYGAKKLPDRAIEDYTAAIRLRPDYPLTYNERGNAYCSKNEFDRGIDDYGMAISLKPDYAFPYHNRGLAYLNKKEFDRSIADFTSAIKFSPRYASAYFNRGRAYYALKKYQDARSDFEKCLELAAPSDTSMTERAKRFLGEIEKTR